MENNFKKAGIIIIGDEILKGHVKDLNSIFLCKRFHAIGVKVCRIATVPDNVAEIAEEVARFSEKYDIVVTTGGIGPTHDDITYEGVAAGLEDRIILNREMATVVRSYFDGGTEVETNPALKMALIPENSKLIYISPKCEEEFEEVKKRNGLEEKKPKKPEKKSFPIIQLKNVYVLPGMMEWLEHAFNHLQLIFENPTLRIYTMVLFLKMSEVKIVEELNKAVKKFEKTVIFGSYVVDPNTDGIQTKIILESTSLDDVNMAYLYLKSILPKQALCSELSYNDAELIYDLTNGTKSLAFVLRKSLKVIEKALKDYTSDEIYLSFNGGKDCTVLLHLVWAVSKKAGNGNIHTIHIRSDATFPEVDKLIATVAEKYNLKLVTIFGPIKAALTELHKKNNRIKAIFMGTRRTDPNAEELQEFQMCDEGWPPLMRVNPILDWSYDNVWDFLRILDVPYCSLYDEGYTSIGNPYNTVPNPALIVPGTQNKYYPAYKLKDGSLERHGRKQIFF